MNLLLASGALQFAFEKSTTEGKITIGVLGVVSLFSWTVIITKLRQLYRARKAGKSFFAAYRASRDPLDIARGEKQFDGAPAYELYYAGIEELNHYLVNQPVTVKGEKRISAEDFDAVKVAVERAGGTQAMLLERGMIVLSTAVAGGPFIGLLGTVWGVMETFSGIARASSASLTAMAPGVAGALIATVIGLLVAIPAMFGYNFMVTTIRSITQELDMFASEFMTSVKRKYVDHRGLADEENLSLEKELTLGDPISQPNPTPAMAL